jgi:hypothetical protein
VRSARLLVPLPDRDGQALRPLSPPGAINTELLVQSGSRTSAAAGFTSPGEIVDGDDILAQARGAFLHVPLEHFLGTPEGQAAAEQWRRRLAAGEGGESPERNTSPKR